MIPQLALLLATCFPNGREAAWPCLCPEEWPTPCFHRPMDPVLKAIKEDDEVALKAMIKDGKNLTEPNKDGWLPLHEAAYYGQLSCLKALQRGEAADMGAARGGSGAPSFWSCMFFAPQPGGGEMTCFPHSQQPPSPPTSPGFSGQERLMPRKGGREG